MEEANAGAGTRGGIKKGAGLEQKQIGRARRAGLLGIKKPGKTSNTKTTE